MFIFQITRGERAQLRARLILQVMKDLEAVPSPLHIPALGPKATPATEEMELLSLAEPKGKSDPVEDGESMFWWPTSSLCHNNHHSCICTPLYRQRVHSQPLLPLSQQ